MKTLLPAFVIALLVHLVILKMDLDWLIRQDRISPKTQVTTMHLVERQSEPLQAIRPLPAPPTPLPSAPKPIVNKKQVVRKPAVKPKPDPPPPQKRVPVKPKAKPESVPTPPTPDPPAMDQPPEPETAMESAMSPPEPQTAAVDPETAPATAALPSRTESPTGTPAAAASEASATVVMARPRYSENPPPAYPSIARKRKYQGIVVLEVFVEEDGRVSDLRIVESSSFAVLDNAAMRTVNKWKFIPGREGSRTVAMWVRVPIRFQLN
jgi:protein TonB